MTRHFFDQLLFALAAAFNLAAAAMIIFQPNKLLQRLNIHDHNARLLARSLASSVTTWGIAYAMIAANPQRFRDFAWLGAISKTIFFLVYASAYLRRQINFQTFVPALIDLVFALLFAEFLWRTAHP